MGNNNELASSSNLEVCYEDENYIAINKPQGLLVHRTKLSHGATTFAVQELRNQVGYHVFPIHRLDRKTSGILLFAKSRDAVAKMQTTFQHLDTTKRYLAIVRGHFPSSIEVNHPLTNADGKQQEALSHFYCIRQTELPIPFGKHSTSRYSLIECFPTTGRMHQLRKHLNHLRFPIIGDRPHGCNKQNKLFLEKWGLKEMLLHANDLYLTHPITKKEIHISATPPEVFQKYTALLSLDHD